MTDTSDATRRGFLKHAEVVKVSGTDQGTVVVGFWFR
jgi:hypothetical protein